MVRRTIGSGIRRLPRNETFKRGLYSLDVSDRLKRYQQVFSIAPEGFVNGLFNKDSLPDISGDEILDCWADLVPLMEYTDELGGLQFIELRSTLPDELLMYVDKLSMAHSLEVRIPYLDREVVEFVERLNSSFKVRKGTRKWLHRRVCRNFLPPSFMKRKKRGFAESVVDDWFRNSAWASGSITDELTAELSDILNHQALERLAEEHQNNSHDHHKMLFSVKVLNEICRQLH